VREVHVDGGRNTGHVASAALITVSRSGDLDDHGAQMALVHRVLDERPNLFGQCGI
jgi:hypothetical protein